MYHFSKPDDVWFACELNIFRQGEIEPWLEELTSLPRLLTTISFHMLVSLGPCDKSVLDQREWTGELKRPLKGKCLSSYRSLLKVIWKPSQCGSFDGQLDIGRHLRRVPMKDYLD